MLIHLKLLYKDYTQHGTNKVVQWVGRWSADLSTNESDRSFVKNRGTQKFWAQHLYCEQIVNFCLTRSHRACLIIAGTKIQWMYLVVHRCTPHKTLKMQEFLSLRRVHDIASGSVGVLYSTQNLVFIHRLLSSSIAQQQSSIDYHGE